MSLGFATPPPTDAVSRLSRSLEPSEWAALGVPLLRSPREVVGGLYERHLPAPGTAVIAVFGPEERLVASASFARSTDRPDGWEFRNALLGQLRRIVPHDLRRRTPVRTAALLFCRGGGSDWSEVDGAWMWGLRDACTLHGLRCGAYIVLTPAGWQVLGEGRKGRRPRSPEPSGGAPAELPQVTPTPDRPVSAPRTLVEATRPPHVAGGPAVPGASNGFAPGGRTGHR